MKETVIKYGSEEDKRSPIDKEIDYFSDYKKRLIQFIISSCAYKSGYYKKAKHNLKANEILAICKEISRIEIFIYDLELFKKEDISVSLHIYNKHIN